MEIISVLIFFTFIFPNGLAYNTEAGGLEREKREIRNDVLIQSTMRAPTRHRKLRYKIGVTTHTDLEQLMQSPPPNRDIWVSIYLQDPFNWPHAATLTNAQKIERLYVSGNFYVDTLLHLLNQTERISYLKLSNRKDKLCPWNEGHGISLIRGIHGHVFLNKTKALMFEDFSASCVAVFMAIAEKVETPNLQGISLKKSQIDSRSIVAVQRLFRKNWNTLTHVRLQSTGKSTHEPLFGSDIGVLVKVEDAVIDNPSEFVSSRFCEVLPNLKNLTSTRGNLSIDDMLHLLPCSNLRKLKVSVRLSSFTQNFEFSFVSEHYKSMEEMEIILVRDSCDDPERANLDRSLRLEGLHTLEENLRHFTVLSNCRLLAVNAGGLRDERRFTEGGLYGLSYDIRQELE